MKNKDIPGTLGFMLGLVIGTFLSARFGLGNLGRILLCVACAVVCGYLCDLAYKRSRPPKAPTDGPDGGGGRRGAFCPRCGGTLAPTGNCPHCGHTP